MTSLARVAIAFSYILVAWSSETCEDNSCTNAAVENLEQQELAEVKMELLQTSMFVGKLDRKTEEFYAPYWCYTVPEYSRASIAACNGGAGSCICMGPTVCGSWGPFPAGTWQSYSYSCCGCVPAPAPAAAVVPAPAVAAPVAAPAVAPAATATAAGGGGGGATASCSAHKGCQDLKLEGVCCPAADGTYLGCCDVSALETKVELTVDTKVVPAWCTNLSEEEKAKAPPCSGSGPASCMCVGQTICGNGAPAPNSWQALSTACCGCQ